MSRKFYRTIISIELLSEIHPGDLTLSEIAHDIVYGDMSGVWEIEFDEELSGPAMAQALINQGSSPEFFNLDDEGNDLERGGLDG